MCWDSRVILLERSRTIAEHRCDLAHAIAHIDLAHRGDTFNTKHEEAANRYAAKLMIGLEPLSEAMAWSDNYAEVAELLRVDERTLRMRLQCLHPAERAYLKQRLSNLGR